MEAIAIIIGLLTDAWDWLWSTIHGWTGIFVIWALCSVGNLESKVRTLERTVANLRYDLEQRRRQDQ